MTIAVDMDGVLCSEEKTFDRALAKPKPGARERLHAWKRAGHTVIVFTARSWSEFRMTEAWLKRHKMPYSSLVMGKPAYDVFVDDRALRFTDWESVGF